VHIYRSCLTLSYHWETLLLTLPPVNFYKPTTSIVQASYILSTNICLEEACYYYICSHKKVKLSLCLNNLALCHEDIWRSGCIDPRFLDLGTSCRWVVSFTPWTLYPQGNFPRYPLDRRLGGPQYRSGKRGEEKIFDRTETRTPTPRSSSSYRLRYPGSQIRIYFLVSYVEKLSVRKLCAVTRWMTEELEIIWKEDGVAWLKWSTICLKWLRKITRKFRQHNWYPGRDSNPGHTE
jgi:hypothetical protein